MGLFSWKKNIEKSAKKALTAGSGTAVLVSQAESMDIPEKALWTALMTILSYAWSAYWNYKKNKDKI